MHFGNNVYNKNPYADRFPLTGSLTIIGVMFDLQRIDKRLSDKFGVLWQIGKFNIVNTSVALVQLILANVLPLVFDSMTIPLPALLRPVFNPEILFPSPGKYVVNGVVTWGYVLPFLLSNTIANIYGYFANMKATFNGKGTRAGFAAYLMILVSLILFSTWLQGLIVAKMQYSRISGLSRTIAATAAGYVQAAVIFPLEKFVLFK